jgi:hypothetical protein
MMGYGLDGQGLNPSRAKFVLSSAMSKQALGPIQPPNHWVLGVIFREVNQLRHETDLSPPSSAEVKNDRAISPLPCTSSWHSAYLIKHRDNSILVPLPLTHNARLAVKLF